MVESLLFIGAGAVAGGKIPGAGQKRTGSATLVRGEFAYCTYVVWCSDTDSTGYFIPSAGASSLFRSGRAGGLV